MKDKIYISPDDCLVNNTCWTKERLEDYVKWHGDGKKVNVKTIFKDPDISVVDKMYIVETKAILSDYDMHSLAISYANHVLSDANVAGHAALRTKHDFLFGMSSICKLKIAEGEAWLEAKHYKHSKAAAFAAKKDPVVALRGAAVFSAGWYGGDVNEVEKKWQWVQMEEVLKKYV